MKQEIDQWRENSGLNYFARPGEDPLKRAIEMAANVNDLNLEQMDESLLVLSSYHNFLSSQSGIISARVAYLEDSLSTRLDLKAARYTAGSAAERRAIALSRDDELSALKEQLSKEQTKQLMLRPVVDSIRLKIDALKKVHDRRGRNVT
jgi:hypothetical protein